MRMQFPFGSLQKNNKSRSSEDFPGAGLHQNSTSLEDFPGVVVTASSSPTDRTFTPPSTRPPAYGASRRVSFDPNNAEKFKDHPTQFGASASGDGSDGVGIEQARPQSQPQQQGQPRRGSLAMSLANHSSLQRNRSGSIRGKRSFLQRARSAVLHPFAKDTEQDMKVIFVMIILPCLISLWYSAAILFPPSAREKYSFILWTDGELTFNENNVATICPRPSICSEGIIQIILITISRMTAFVSYVFMGVTFLSKMHFTVHLLSTSYIREFVPFESLHHFHTFGGKFFAGLAVLHTLGHYVRYILRRDVDQLGTKVHISGLISILLMVLIVLCMSPVVKKFKDSIGKFERRINCHWLFVVLVFALCFHHPRTRIITLIFFGLWALDYIYGMVFGTYNLEVVELLPLPGESGVQMLFRNPQGFRPKSGEYVKVQLPWLSHGGNEWHPFSIYLKESTQHGLNFVHRTQSLSQASMGEMGQLSLDQFIRLVLLSDFEDEAMDAPKSLLVEEAREDLSNRYPTTQIFINPVGDWSKGLVEDIKAQKQLRACWVKGPYTSPYFVAREFSHLVLTASGIGITPALGVMGQYPGFSRTKILVWSTRDKDMLKFFAPLIKDAHLAVVFYTGKDKLTSKEVYQLSGYGNIYIQQSRPKSLPGTIASIIVEFENFLNLTDVRTLKEVDPRNIASWCILYCGGSVRIRDDLKALSKKSKVNFEYEMFDW